MTDILATLRAEATAKASDGNGGWSVSDRVTYYLAALRDLEGSGDARIAGELEALLRIGAREHLRDFDRPPAEPGRTRRGHLRPHLPATLPATNAKGGAMRLPLRKARRSDVVRAIADANKRTRGSRDRADALALLLADMDRIGARVVGSLADAEAPRRAA